MADQHDEHEKSGAHNQVVVVAATSGKADYQVGRGRPPEQYKWKKGQSGNPSGRPRKKLDQRAILEGIMNEPLLIREDGKPRKVKKYDALVRSHLAKAIKGDTPSAKWITAEMARLDVGHDEDGGGVAALPAANHRSGQSDALFANLNLDALSEEEQIELARHGQTIDEGGDFTALSLRDFERAQHIANKGRGKDVTPR